MATPLAFDARRRSADELVVAVVRQRTGELLRFARRFSLCADDAQDAYQRSVEIFLRRMRTEPPEKPIRWLQTVVRYEAMAVRADRDRVVGVPFEDDCFRDSAGVDPADRVEQREILAQTAEALRQLKPQERLALTLRAAGLSYREICESTSWSYTRCNRAITEGRRALRTRLRAVESGRAQSTATR
jgi:RNA polymerase sigma factor (sigma-70 family)